jgi:hypothetical protein
MHLWSLPFSRLSNLISGVLLVSLALVTRVPWPISRRAKQMTPVYNRKELLSFWVIINHPSDTFKPARSRIGAEWTQINAEGVERVWHANEPGWNWWTRLVIESLPRLSPYAFHKLRETIKLFFSCGIRMLSVVFKCLTPGILFSGNTDVQTSTKLAFDFGKNSLIFISLDDCKVLLC